jgi:hypothetical protein
VADAYADRFAIRRQSNRRLWRYVIARICQKQTGTTFSLVVGIPKSALSLQGDIKTFNDTGDSGQPVLWSFCPNCGFPIMSDVAVMPELTFLKAGTLDDILATPNDANILRQRSAPGTAWWRNTELPKNAGLTPASLLSEAAE